MVLDEEEYMGEVSLEGIKRDWGVAGVELRREPSYRHASRRLPCYFLSTIVLKEIICFIKINPPPSLAFLAI